MVFPARQYSVNGERCSFALLRPVTDPTGQGVSGNTSSASSSGTSSSSHGPPELPTPERFCRRSGYFDRLGLGGTDALSFLIPSPITKDR